MSPCRACCAFLACLLLPLVVPSQGQPAAPPSQIRTDGYGDPLPPDALARLGTVRLRHTDDIQCVAFSPDGKTLASGGADAIHLWDVATGKEVRRFADARRELTALPFSRDGKALFSFELQSSLVISFLTGVACNIASGRPEVNAKEGSNGGLR